MAFDIYGNVLRPGYCEVHPNVSESYPCSVCYAESKARQMDIDYRQAMSQQQNVAMEHQRLQHELTMAMETIVTLEGKLNASQTRVLLLETQISAFVNCPGCGRKLGPPHCNVCDNDE